MVFILGKVYRLFGWEYRKPVREALACTSLQAKRTRKGESKKKNLQEPENVAAG